MSESKHTPIYAGKYTFVQPDNDYKVMCLRYKVPWMVFEKGSNAINALLNEFGTMKDSHDALLAACEALLAYIEKEHDSLGDMAYFSTEVRGIGQAAIAEAKKGA